MKRLADPEVVVRVGLRLFQGHTGRENAITGEALRAELERLYGVPVGSLRRIGEAVEALIEQGHPICSTSALGYWYARTVEELRESWAESRKRALKALRRERFQRRAMLRMKGQQEMVA